MFKLFSKNRSKYWRVVFKDYKGEIQATTVKAESRLDAFMEMRRIFKRADVLDAVEV